MLKLVDSKEMALTVPPPIPELIEITWVQCDSCEKWRRVPSGVGFVLLVQLFFFQRVNENSNAANWYTCIEGGCGVV